MNGTTVIVTGASRGLGAAISRAVARLGASVVLAARSLDRLEDVAKDIEAAGGKALAVRADVSRKAACREVVRQSLERFGRIDALINNGGTVEPIGPIAETDPQAWQASWSVNVLGPVMLVQMSLPYLRKTGGRIINITSGSTANAIAGWGAYSSAKAAVNHLTKILAAEEPDITALALRPGIVDTDMQATIREKGKSRMAERNYKWLYELYKEGRLLPPEKPARAVACLALYAPHDWSGENVQWDDEAVQQLVREVWPPDAS